MLVNRLPRDGMAAALVSILVQMLCTAGSGRQTVVPNLVLPRGSIRKSVYEAQPMRI